MPEARLHLLGGFRLQNAMGAEQAVPSRKGQALLALLGATAPRPVARERLVDLLWRNLPEERARHSLRQLLTVLRRQAPFLSLGGEHVALDLSTCAVDVAELGALALRGDPESLERAARLCAGPLLQGMSLGEPGFDEWLDVERRRLGELAAGVLRRAAHAAAGDGRIERAEELLRQWLLTEPACEEAHRLLIEMLAASGRRSAALQQFEACRAALRDQFDAEPQAQTVAAYQSIRAVEPARGLPALAVLPPANLGRSAECEALGSALVEDLGVQLARLPGLEVISPQETGNDVRAIAKATRARYLLTSSVRQPQDGVTRVSLQLIEGESAQYLWSMQAEMPLPAPRTEIDRLVAVAVANLEQQLNLAESRSARVRSGATPAAWDRLRQASTVLFARGWSPEAVLEAVELYREAIALDPTLALARAQKALILALSARWGIIDGSDFLDEARTDAEQALLMEPRRSEVLGTAGCAIADLGNPTRALPLLERAVEENPGNAQAWAALGSTLLLLRRVDEGIASLRRGLAISSTDYRRSVWQTALAGGLARLKQHDEARTSAEDACRSDANFYPARIVLAAVLMKLGRSGEAARALGEARRLQPTLRLGQVRLWAAGRSLDRLMKG